MAGGTGKRGKNVPGAPGGALSRVEPARSGAGASARAAAPPRIVLVSVLAAALAAALWAAWNEAGGPESRWARRIVAPAQVSPGVVAGYAPDYRLDHISSKWWIIEHYLTDVILFSVGVKPGGALDLDLLGEERAKKFVARVHSLGDKAPRVLICVGGGGRSAGFRDAARSPNSRMAFATAVNNVLRTLSADGVDLDWEAPQNQAEIDAYALLIEETKRALGASLVTVAVHVGQDLGTRAWKAVDRIHLMAYDMVSCAFFSPSSLMLVGGVTRWTRRRNSVVRPGLGWVDPCVPAWWPACG